MNPISLVVAPGPLHSTPAVASHLFRQTGHYVTSAEGTALVGAFAVFIVVALVIFTLKRVFG